MLTSSSRPRFFNLFKIYLPMAGLMSIAHRISGLFLCLSLPFFITLFHYSLKSQADFQMVYQFLSSMAGTIILFIFLWAIFHHLLAGIRYLLIDMGYGVERQIYQKTAWQVIILAPLFALILCGLIHP